MHDLFLCHTGADKDWVGALATQLEREEINGRRLTVFFDKWDIDYGEHILERIEEGLKSSRFVGIVLSPSATGAQWPRAEWQSQAFDDPLNRRGRLLPILRHLVDPTTKEAIEIPPLLKPLKRFDFTSDKRAKLEYPRLVARIRGERPSRGDTGRKAPPTLHGGSEAPDMVRESVISNLLPVLRHPPWIYSDFTTALKRKDVWDVMKGRIPPFVLHGNRLYSFVNPAVPGSPFRAMLSGTDAKRERAVDWLGDPDKANLLTWMYNDALREHCYHLRIRTPKNASRREKHRYFCPVFDDKPRMFAWRKGARPRTLAKLVTQRDGSPLGVHHASRMRFITLNGEMYLLVDPGWLFTQDGLVPLTGPGVAVFSTMWGGKERNAAVLRNVLMWAILLAKGESSIMLNCGPDAEVAVSPVPAHAETPLGINDDAISLEGLIGGVGAGEMDDQEVDELDAVAEARALSLLAAEGEGDELRDGETDDAGNDPFESDMDDEDLPLTATLELPF
jgi:hypothetical protein